MSLAPRIAVCQRMEGIVGANGADGLHVLKPVEQAPGRVLEPNLDQIMAYSSVQDHLPPPKIATLIVVQEKLWIALGTNGGHGHRVQNHAARAPGHVPGPKMDHLMVVNNAMDHQPPPNHATQGVALWIALGIAGAHGVVVQRLVVQAHRHVQEPNVVHKMVADNAPDHQDQADHATHKAATFCERAL